MEKSWPFLLLLHYYLLSCSLATAATNLQTDQISLLALKSRITLNSSRLTLAKSWTNKTSVCSWTGVTCGRRHRRVVALDVSDMGLNGSIPPEIGNLSFLASLKMPQNSFHGDLPAEMGGLRRLRAVDLSENDFSGEIPRSWFGNATLLEEIYLTGNSFSGMNFLGAFDEFLLIFMVCFFCVWCLFIVCAKAHDQVDMCVVGIYIPVK